MSVDADVVVRAATSPDDLAGARAVRVRVFCEEQGVSAAEEFDGRDDEARHWVAVTPDGRVVGTARLLGGGPGQDARLGRMAVEAAWRGRGIAGVLLARADEAATALGAPGTRLMAQLPAVAVYERGGYAVTDREVVLDAGIEHLRMRRAHGVDPGTRS